MSAVEPSKKCASGEDCACEKCECTVLRRYAILPPPPPPPPPPPLLLLLLLSRARVFSRSHLLDAVGRRKKKKKKKKKRSTTNFRGWVGNREEEVKENENVPLDRRARARVRKRRSKVCSFGKNGKKRVPRSRHFLGGGGCFFARIFFSFPSKSKKRYKKKYDSERPQNYFREQNSDVSLSLSLSISLPADTIMRRILLPIDSTGEDVDVLKWVIENVHRAGDQIVLLHVYVSLFLFFFILLSRM